MNITLFKRLRKSFPRRALLYVASVALGFMLGARFEKTATAEEKPAYLIASWEILHPDKTKPFGDAVIPLAQKAGLTPLAAGFPEVLEGHWPQGSMLFVQRYHSLQALLDFWRSPAHAEVIKLREGHVNSHFVVAVEECCE